MYVRGRIAHTHIFIPLYKGFKLRGAKCDANIELCCKIYSVHTFLRFQSLGKLGQVGANSTFAFESWIQRLWMEN